MSAVIYTKLNIFQLLASEKKTKEKKTQLIAMCISEAPVRTPTSTHTHTRERLEALNIQVSSGCTGVLWTDQTDGWREETKGWRIVQHHMWSSTPAQENVRHLCLSLSYASVFSQSEKCTLQFGCSVVWMPVQRSERGHLKCSDLKNLLHSNMWQRSTAVLFPGPLSCYLSPFYLHSCQKKCYLKPETPGTCEMFSPH